MCSVNVEVMYTTTSESPGVKNNARLLPWRSKGKTRNRKVEIPASWDLQPHGLERQRKQEKASEMEHINFTIKHVTKDKCVLSLLGPDRRKPMRTNSPCYSSRANNREREDTSKVTMQQQEQQKYLYLSQQRRDSACSTS